MNKGGMDPKKTYLFEIILPNESHIVDYGDDRQLILLNVVDTKSGVCDDWSSIESEAKQMGTRTALDLTERFKGMTIAEIYEFAQKEGNLINLEGLMCQYRDKDGKLVTVKVKAREYDDKKFVRDRLDWEKLLDKKNFDIDTLDINEERRERLLGYNFDNTFANAALETRITWVRDRINEIVKELAGMLVLPSERAKIKYDANLASGMNKASALRQVAGAMVPELIAQLETMKSDSRKIDLGYILAFLKSVLSEEVSPESKLRAHAFKIVQDEIEAEGKKRPKNSFWLVPEI